MNPTVKLLVLSLLLTGVAVTSHANARKKRNIEQLLTTLQGLRPLNDLLPINGNNRNVNLSNNPSLAGALHTSGDSFPVQRLLGNLVPGRNQLQEPFAGGPLNGIIGTAVSRLTSASNPSVTSPPEEGPRRQTDSSTQGNGHGISSSISEHLVSRPGSDQNGSGTDSNGNLLGTRSQHLQASPVRNALHTVYHGISSRSQKGTHTSNSRHEEHRDTHFRPSRGHHDSGSGSGSREGNHSTSEGSQEQGSSGSHGDSSESGDHSSGGNSS